MKKAVILAAGRGTRMKSDSFKVMHEVGGRPMILGLLETLLSLSCDEVIVVVSPEMQKLEAVLSPARIAVQSSPLGTGHAVLAAKDQIGVFEGTCFILFGDTPLLTKETLEKGENLLNTGKDVAVIGFEPENAGRYGRLVVDKDGLEAIIEYKDATEAQRAIRLCNSGAMCVSGKHLIRLLSQVQNKNAAGEYYLTDIVQIAKKEGLSVGYVIADAREVSGVNSRSELAAAEKVFQDRKRAEFMEKGVSLLDPQTAYFSYDTQIENDVVIEPCVYCAKGVRIKKGARIPAFSRLENEEVTE